jgi:hypothetical protein
VLDVNGKVKGVRICETAAFENNNLQTSLTVLYVLLEIRPFPTTRCRNVGYVRPVPPIVDVDHTAASVAGSPRPSQYQA